MMLLRRAPIFNRLTAPSKAAMRQVYLNSKLQEIAGSALLTLENAPIDKVAQYFKETIMEGKKDTSYTSKHFEDTVGLIGNLEYLGETKIVDELFESMPQVRQSLVEYYPPKRDRPYPHDMRDWNEWIELNLSSYIMFSGGSGRGDEDFWVHEFAERWHETLEAVLSKGITVKDIKEFEENDIPVDEWPEWCKVYSQGTTYPDEEWFNQRAAQAYKDGKLNPGGGRDFVGAVFRQILSVKKEKLHPNSKIAVLVTAGRRHPKMMIQDAIHEDLLSSYGDAITWVKDLEDDGWGQPEGRHWLAFQVDEGKLP